MRYSAIKELWARARGGVVASWRNRAMQRLYRVPKSPKKREKILLWVPGGMPLMLHLEGAVAAALKLRGYDVHAILCDGVFSACVKREITDQTLIEKWGEACGPCKRICSNTLTELGISHSFIGDYVSKQELDEARRASDMVTWDTIDNLSCHGVLIGSNVKSAILRYLKGHDVPTDSKLVREYTYSGMVCAAAARNALNKHRPSRLFMSHGTYVDWGPALHTALKMQIPIVAWMASYLPARFYFKHVQDGLRIDFHSISAQAWDRVASMPFTRQQRARLDDYLIDRYQKDASFDMKRFKTYTGTICEVIARYGLDKTRPIWGIMAHINWDAVSDYAPMLYESFNEWMIDTIKTVKDIPGVQWLVKVHPAEAWDNPDSGVESLLRQNFHDLPENIRILPAEEEISPLDFFDLVDGAITVYGTAGLELAIRGKPVILAGDAHYGKRGFTLDAESKDAYKELLRSVAYTETLTKSQIELAQKYAYCYFILRQIPISVVTDPCSKWWRFQFDKRERLLPGADPMIDFLCERILDGTDFIMSQELEDTIGRS